MVALVNTAEDTDTLADLDGLNRFAATYRWSGRRDYTQRELEDVRALRPRLREFWFRDEDGVVELVNELLREYRALPQLMRHDEFGYHFHATPMDAPFAERMAVEAAMSMSDVIRADELSRLRVCGMPDCESVLIDLSKNRSKRYCDLNCSNRAAVTAYRARKSAG
jgi:predicted RNA-binding Zn ribbon-like protein